MPRCGARRRRSTATDRSRATSSAWQGGFARGRSIRSDNDNAERGSRNAEQQGEFVHHGARPSVPRFAFCVPRSHGGWRTVTSPRTVRAPRGPERSCKGWIQEAALRMLMNNLDPEVAERPQDLIVYGGTGKAARSWDAYHQIVRALRGLGNDETLLIQSGKPVGVFRTQSSAPRVLISNAMLVPKWANWETFWELEAAGLTMYGQMTAGSWIYIGTQGILQGTYETLGELASQRFGSSLKGRIVLTAGLGGMGGAQPLAVTMNEGVALCVEVDPSRIERRIKTRYLDRETETLDEAVAWVEEARAAGEAVSIGLLGNAAETHPELLRRGFRPDVVTDQTSAHDPLDGYVPGGLSLEEALFLRETSPDDYVKRAHESMAAQVEAM